LKESRPERNKSSEVIKRVIMTGPEEVREILQIKVLGVD
jgi:hypothetical protein